MKKDYWGKLAFTSILGLILSNTFVFLAALPIRYLRLIFGRKAFLLSTAGSFAILAGFGFWRWALVYLSLSFLIGLYRELEEKRFPLVPAAAVAILTTAAANFAIIYGYTKIQGVGLQAMLAEKLSPIYDQLKQVSRFKETEMETFLWYIPSGLIITMMVILFVSLTISKVPSNSAHHLKLRKFQLPDWMIWFFILSLGATFIPTSITLVSHIGMNVLAVTLAAYFFQGLAVFTHFLDRLKIHGFWRLLAYFLVFFQMFIFISGLGIIDYWFDFRSQATRRIEQNT